MFSCDGTCGHYDGVKKAIEVIELLMLQGKICSLWIDVI